jgi:hypothetical protein
MVIFTQGEKVFQRRYKTQAAHMHTSYPRLPACLQSLLAID